MFIEESKCIGCMACKNICPVGAITLKEKDGFSYPEIIEEKCIGCNMCKSVCPVLNYEKEYEKKVCAYACKNNDEKIRMESTSGGIFTLLATHILNKGGVVYAVAFNKLFEAEHIRINNINELEKIRGSKYIQSNIGDSYKMAKKDLEEGKLVLFTGTPCQIEGIRTFLGKEYDNLFLQDIICHGVPSKKVFKKYLEYKEKNLGNIESFSFRNKDNKGWNNYQLHLVGTNNNEYVDHSEDTFMKFFLRDISLRESCYQCLFKKKYRLSDITLADLWGIDEICPEMNDEKGTSLVVINSEKGMNLFNSISDSMIKREISLDDAINHNKSMIKSAPFNENRKEFFKDIDNNEYEELVEKYL